MRQITCSGIAQNAKLGAIILGESLGCYVSGLDAWPPEVLGKLVEATGDLVERKDVPDPVIDEYGGVSSGMVGPRTILLNAEWRIISGEK